MFLGYFAWHYSYAYADGYRIFLDGLSFLWRFFSFERLIRTLARPLGTAAARGLLVRSASRVVGMAVRATLVVVGAFVVVGWCLFAVGAAVVWPFMPIVSMAALVASVIGLSVAP